MKVKTSELTGPALRWAVAIAIGHKPRFGEGCYYAVEIVDWNKPGGLVNGCRFEPDHDWEHGGQLQDRYDVEIRRVRREIIASARTPVHGYGPGICDARIGPPMPGRDRLQAICRAVVALNLGHEVEIPDKLLPPGHIEKPAGIEGLDICMHCHAPLTKPPIEACDQCGKDQIPF